MITPEQAYEALNDLDDCARMNCGIDAIGPRALLKTFIDETTKRKENQIQRFIVMHSSEAGFSSTEEAQEWIDRQTVTKDWRVVEILVDPQTETIANLSVLSEISRARYDGIQTERKRLRDLLNLNDF